MSRERAGTLLCLFAAVAYSTQQIFAKFAYAAVVGVVPLPIAAVIVLQLGCPAPVPEMVSPAREVTKIASPALL